MKKNIVLGNNGSFATILGFVVLYVGVFPQISLVVDAAANMAFQKQKQRHDPWASLIFPFYQKMQEEPEAATERVASCPDESPYLREKFPPTDNSFDPSLIGRDISSFLNCSDNICDYSNLLEHIRPACEIMNGQLYAVSIPQAYCGFQQQISNYPVCVEPSCDGAYVQSLLAPEECTDEGFESVLVDSIILDEACSADMQALRGTSQTGIGSPDFALEADMTWKSLYCDRASGNCDFAPFLTPDLIDQCEEQGGYLYSITDQVTTQNTLRYDGQYFSAVDEEGFSVQANKPICIAISCGDPFVYLEKIIVPAAMYFRNGTVTVDDNGTLFKYDAIYEMTKFSAVSDILVTGNILERELNEEEGTMGNSSQGSNIFAHNNGQGESGNETSTSSSSESGNETSPSTPSLVEDAAVGGNKTFLNAGELRVALSQYYTNQSALVIAKYGKIEDWNVSLVGEMKGLFRNMINFNENISAWDVANVADMSQMFLNATNFNGPLTFWNTMKVTTMVSTFQWASNFSKDISAWNTSRVTEMGDMFRGASSFNGDIAFWNVGRVTDMSTMFWEATSFNVDISNWNVMRVRDFTGTFRNATAFSQKLCWQLRENANIELMFCGSNGGGFREECICNYDLYYDEKCVNPSVVREATCNESYTKSAAAPVIAGMPRAWWELSAWMAAAAMLFAYIV